MIESISGVHLLKRPVSQSSAAMQEVNMFRVTWRMLFCATLVFTARAEADVLYLYNGDRISGTLAGLGEGTLRFRGAYTAEFSVPWSDVLALTTEEEVDVVLRESGAVSGRLILLDDEQGLAFDGEARQITLGDIVTIAVPGLEMVAEASPDAPAEASEAAAPPKWSGTVSAGATWHKGATDAFDAVTGVAVTRQWPKDTLTMKAEAAYGEVESQKNTERMLGELKWQHYWTERFYFYWLGGAEHDAGRQLDLRLRTNVGLGREFIRTERRKLSLEAGAGYRREYWLEYSLIQERVAREASRRARQARLNQYLGELGGLSGLQLVEASLRYLRDAKDLEFENETSSEDSISAHVSSHYEQQVFARSLFTSDVTFEPDVDDWSNYRILSDLSFLTPLSEKMSLKMRLNSEYDSYTGGVDAESWDHKFMTGLEYKF
ncbi:MAG TPA: DUF481 domain-containing protein [Candidatus Hydrogenedentes bacterium]|jgi:putative salt-induced outer membrane protein YdiY|nr:DUF481 domain-containing protein [Candidatus Hydrogenedentota bacterium]HPJ98394.1 DUF481 domain-containing protein [Candidatus Hydrogenedentota bacterium]